MAQELGKVHKPEAESFGKGRKIFLVPLLYSGKDAPVEYIEKFDRYWDQVTEQVRNLEGKIGTINRIYHESITLSGEEGLKSIEGLNQKSYQIARQMCRDKARIDTVEDAELLNENMDWQRCLLLGFVSNKVATKISEYYIETSTKRYEYISKRIDETLSKDEIAVLFIREGHRVQFPKDIQVFSVAPPALDEIHRWLRDMASREKSEDTK
jgi:hypothetical protein